jgi:hypothetical protein
MDIAGFVTAAAGLAADIEQGRWPAAADLCPGLLTPDS